MSDVLYRATKYMNAEDALLAREEKPERGKDRRTHDRIGGKIWLERKIDEMKGALDPPLGSSRASPH